MKSSLLFISFLVVFNGITQIKIAIIGGGIAGIASAHYIHSFDPKAEITVFEKESKVGGNAQTIEVKNSLGENVQLDIGPQYFVKGPWDDYLQFLDESLGIQTIISEKVDASLLIQNKGSNTPLIVSPSNGKLRGESISNLWKFRKFMLQAYQVYQNQEIWEGKTIADWLPTLKLDSEYKKSKILPFLAASLGTSVADIQMCSVNELMKLFAFRKPKLKTEFNIMQAGMGNLVIRVANKIANEGVDIRTSSPVFQIIKSQNGFQISYKKGGDILHDTVEYDFVVLAVHADVAGTLLENIDALKQSATLLKQFPYFKANIVVHKDTNLINNHLPTFLNIFTSEQHEVLSSTMNLSIISPRLTGIYKSWLTEDDKKKIIVNGTFIHETTFWHPLITPQFVSNLDLLSEQMKQLNNIVNIGGWTEGLETQNSAVLSAQRSLEKYRLFYENFKKK